MRRLSTSLLLTGLSLGVTSVAHAYQPPTLPPPDADPVAEPPPPTADTTDPAGMPPAGDPTSPAPAADPTADPTATPEGPAPDAGASLEGDASTAGQADISLGAAGADAAMSDDPGMVMGRREPVINSLRGSVGHYYTQLPDVGGNYTFRMRMHTDFFKKKRMFVDHPDFGPDEHSRVRGSVLLGFSFLKWFEAYFGVSSSANRNARTDPARTDPPTVFALGDIDFGLKGAWRSTKKGVGVGGQLGFGLLSGTERLAPDAFNFAFDVLFALDLRYLTAKHAPVRFAVNAGWMLDNSHRIVDFGAIEDPSSREVLRFSMGANNSRVRTRYAVDFPIRVGKDRQVGIDPVIEYSWDISTRRDEDFRELTELAGSASPLPRTMSWLTVGLRVNPWSGMFLDAAVDVGTVSPNYEFGPPVPPYQIILGIGWAFDPAGAIKKVEVPVEPEAAPEPAVLDGRVIGQLTDANGAPVQAKVSFPGLATNAILTDEAGGFVSYRLPEGMVTVHFELADGTVFDETAEIRPGEDTRLDVQLEGAAPKAVPDEGTVDGTFSDDTGKALKISMHVTGNGIDEPFLSNDSGRIAVALPVGTYSAKISAAGYLPKTIPLEVKPGETLQIAERLQSETPPETPNVKGTPKAIRLKKGIRYDGEGVSDASHAILDELATFLSYHPEYQLVEIRVHTDDRGNPSARSQARADSVKSYLVSKGVAADRIEATGRGAKDPVAVNLTAEGRKQNNRTELRVRNYAAAQ
jgi:outer membrane protein OmpA-like peptidoglycan-associated protein